MKTLVFTIVALIFSCTKASAIQVDRVELKNTGFEQAENEDPSKIADWLFSEFSALASDNQTFRSGKKSLLVDHGLEKKKSIFFQYMKARITPAKLYRLTAFMKMDNVDSGFAGLYADLQNAQGSIYFNDMEVQHLHGTSDWKQCKIEFIADETADYLVVGGHLNGSGKVWFDDFTLEEVEPTKPAKQLRALAKEVSHIIATHSIKKDAHNERGLLDTLMRFSGAGQLAEDLYPAVDYVLNNLKDHHSHFMTPDARKKWESSQSADAYTPPSGKMIDGDIAFISIGSFGSGNAASTTRYADHLQDVIRQLNDSKPLGWIIDLRENSGGNAYAMIAGAGPLLKEGVVGYFIGKDGRASSWFYHRGSSGFNKKSVVTTSLPSELLIDVDIPIAILISEKTASAGEVLVTSFKGRAKSHLFGQPTAGQTTNNEMFSLSDGSAIFLATSWYADIKKTQYKSKIAPDVQILPQKQGELKDEALEQAQLWIRNKK